MSAKPITGCHVTHGLFGLSLSTHPALYSFLVRQYELNIMLQPQKSHSVVQNHTRNWPLMAEMTFFNEARVLHLILACVVHSDTRLNHDCHNFEFEKGLY